ncbi:MAG: nicotinate-nucleotide adenylyltransferase [Bacteroidales bacterium]|nr:nicotinate-nucleotide adenylyltransferase [Bacteroidales bacterium]
MKRIGLFFGSFNPIHIGHLAIANYFVSFTDLHQVWFVVSPQNPLKEKQSLLADYHRLQLVDIAIGDSPLFRSSKIEFELPKPSYTIHTLSYLSEKYPEYEFVLLLGADNLQSFHKWKNYTVILENYELMVYPRPGYEVNSTSFQGKIQVIQAPLMEISSSFIRQAIGEGKDVRFFMPKAVADYIDEMNFYKNH